MPPKFQSSFIPKGPVSTASPTGAVSRVRDRSLFSFLATLIFALSVAAAVGVFAYKVYLNYSIKRMGAELEAAREVFAPDVVRDLVRLNDRIISTDKLLERHRVLTPLMSFLETSTPKSVRFTEFNYSVMAEGPQILLKGEARGYSALALESAIIQGNPDFKSPVFSDIQLDTKGNVIFTLHATLSSELLSYQRELESLPIAKPTIPSIQASTSTPSTNSGQAATSTI